MATTRDNVADFIDDMLSDQFHLPTSYFKEKDDLRKKWLFDDRALVAFGKAINQSNWHTVYVTPLEMVKCKTIGDVIDLLWGKIKNG
jgi:hypothetical protein